MGQLRGERGDRMPCLSWSLICTLSIRLLVSLRFCSFIAYPKLPQHMPLSTEIELSSETNYSIHCEKQGTESEDPAERARGEGNSSH